MKLTVAICTWNRASLLHETLLRMRDLAIPDGISWELIVANNNCTDHTDEVIERHQESLPIRRLFVVEQGLSHCRNAVIEAATGDWILCTDDDVLVDPNWLGEYAAAIASYPESTFMGGSISPWFESPPPKWLEKHFSRLEGAFAVTPSDLTIHQLDVASGNDTVFGANMAFCTKVLREFPFDSELGLVGNKLKRGEETDMIERLMAAGHSGIWVGPATVQHYIPTARMTTKYLWNFFSTLFGRPRWAVRGWMGSAVLAKVLQPFKNRLWLHHFSRAATCAGVISESRYEAAH